MMMPDESSKINIDDYGSSRLLHDIEEISKALYLPKSSTPPKHVRDDLSLNNKKSSIWKWKPLKALTQIRNHRLNCSFFLHIHSIEGLPPNFNDLILRVYWKRKHEVLKSHCIRVNEDVAKFEETLIHRCSVHVSKRDPHDDVAKYTSKLSLLYASIVGAPNLDIGKHWIDLTKLLPLTLIELDDEKNRYGKWITSFKLTGKAKGAIINVSFGFSLSGNFLNVPDNGNAKMLQRVRSIPTFDIKDHNGIVPYEGPSINHLYELLDDKKSSYLIPNEVFDEEFRVIDKGIELTKSVENSCIDTIDVAELFDDFETDNACTEESDEELDLFLRNLSLSESRDLDFSFRENEFLENDYHMKNKEICEEGKMVKSRSVDDLTSNVINEFMNLVGSDSEPESPRERLLRQFENETLIFDLDNKKDQNDRSTLFDSSFLFREPENQHDYETGPSLINRRKAKILENLETDELMQKWGLNERSFQNSPRTDSGAFGSPVYFSPERPHELPPIGNGLGPFLKTGNDGFLRSMDPLLFKKAKNGEKLILQVTNSVVLPIEMGSNGYDILMKWATVGSKKMIFQGNRLMPVEEITGKMLQLAAWKMESEMEVDERGHTLLHESKSKQTPTNIYSEHVSVSNIIPLAIEKFQYFLIEGLRIQSGMSTEEEPRSTIKSTPTTNIDIEKLIDTSISLQEWIIKKPSDQTKGYFSNFTLALRILLRDPLRDYEPVGIPMLVLVQVSSVDQNVNQMFKVNEVYVTGFKADLQKKQRSGFRWLNSSGLTGKTKKKYPLTKSTVLTRSSIRSIMNKGENDEVLWSISCYGRNPDIVF